MPAKSFFALCKLNGQLSVKRLNLDSKVQTLLEAMFESQESDFKSGTQNEIEFNGDWRPDDEDVLYVEVPGQTDVLTKAIESSPLSVPVLNAKNFAEEGVTAIFTGRVEGKNTIVAIQNFTARQLLSHKVTLTLSGDTLNRLTNPTFTLDNKLVALIEGGKLKFKSYHNIRSIFDLIEFFRAATDDDIDSFAGHACLMVKDVASLKSVVDQTARKLIHAIQRDGLLDDLTATEIQKRAKKVKLVVNVENGKVQMPTTRSDIKLLLQFLHDDIYEGPLSGRRFVTNSKRPA